MVHCIEEITPAVVQELKEGSISFQIYAYPPSNVAMPESDGGAAIKKRMTMRGRATDTVSPEAEAKALGLKAEVNDVDAAADDKKSAGGGAGGSGKANLRRKATLTESGKLEQKQVVGIKEDGTAVTTNAPGTKVQAVGKEGSACCSIF